MGNVAVLTDLCTSIPEELLTQLNIHTVAYYIHRGQEVLRDLVTINRSSAWMMALSSHWGVSIAVDRLINKWQI